MKKYSVKFKIEFSNNTKSMKKLQKSINETYLMIESHKAENDEELSVPANATVQGKWSEKARKR